MWERISSRITRTRFNLTSSVAVRHVGKDYELALPRILGQQFGQRQSNREVDLLPFAAGQDLNINCFIGIRRATPIARARRLN